METTSTTEKPKNAASLANSLGVGLAMLAGMFIVVRPGNQFSPYTGPAAFAGLIAAVFGFFVAALTFLHPQRVRVSRALTAALLAWLALFAFGLWRSPNLGGALPMAGDAGMYALMLLCGVVLAQLEPLLIGAITRAVIGMVAVEAFVGVWQRQIDIPLLQSEVAKGAIDLPEQMKSGMGVARIGGNLAFGSFANPNSLAGYLLIGIFLLLGILCVPLVARPPVPRGNKTGDGAGGQAASSTPPSSLQSMAPMLFGWFVMLWMIAGLATTGSKGGLAAAVAGAWFFVAQWLSKKSPLHRRIAIVLTIAGVTAAVGLLALGTLGMLWPKPFGLSMEVRLDYWRSALAMWREHPFAGTGLGGFTDNYPLFKMPMGEEVKDTHNDFLQLATELGLLAPLIYGAIWWLVCGAGFQPASVPQASNLSVPGNASDQAGLKPARRGRTLDLCVVTGGVLAFLLMDYGFSSSWFDAEGLFNLVHGQRDRISMLGALQTFMLPIIFAATVMVLQPLTLVLNDSWTFGCRAAIGAVLVHELVDFDFRAPATMAAIFLCGGLLAGQWAGATPDSPGAGTFARKLPSLALLALVLLLFPIIAWIPLRSSSPRANAEDLEAEVAKRAKEVQVKGAESPEAQSIPQIRADILDERKKARDAAPFDADTWLDLGNALVLMPPSHDTRANHQEALACFERAAALRPLSFVPKMVLGQYYMQHGFAALAGREDSAPELFKRARKWFAETAERYPLHPGLKLSMGDAALMSGDAAGAMDVYAQAFEIDMRIDDNTVRLTAIFTDPRPGAFPQHGFDGEAFIIKQLSQAAQLPLQASIGLDVRRLVSLAWILHQNQITPSLSGEALKRTRTELTAVAGELVSAAPDLRSRAHAALLRALATRLLADDQRAAIAEKLWDEAIALQQESVEKGQPGTPQKTFDTILNLYRK